MNENKPATVDHIDAIATEATIRVLDMDWNDPEPIKAVIAGAILKGISAHAATVTNPVIEPEK